MYSKCRGLVLAELLGKHTSQNNILFMRGSTISKDSFVHPSVIKVSSRSADRFFFTITLD